MSEAFDTADVSGEQPRPRGRPRKDAPEVATLEVLILRKYVPVDAEPDDAGVFSPVFAGEIVCLPIAEAKRVVKAGIATFPDEA